MTAILYPVAKTAEAALHAPLGYAVRGQEAERLAVARVSFVSEAVGPAFATREAALAAYSADARLDGPTVGRGGARLDETHGVRLVPVAVSKDSRPVVSPTYRSGRRWPVQPVEAAVLWRLSISFWRIDDHPLATVPMTAARRLRRDEGARDLEAPMLSALAHQPLRALKPQQPLDIGLFEICPPEAPDTLIPDE